MPVESKRSMLNRLDGAVVVEPVSVKMLVLPVMFILLAKAPDKLPD